MTFRYKLSIIVIVQSYFMSHILSSILSSWFVCVFKGENYLRKADKSIVSPRENSLRIGEIVLRSFYDGGDFLSARKFAPVINRRFYDGRDFPSAWNFAPVIKRGDSFMGAILLRDTGDILSLVRQWQLYCRIKKVLIVLWLKYLW